MVVGVFLSFSFFLMCCIDVDLIDLVMFCRLT